MRPNIIYSSTRSIKCRDLRNLLEFKKIEVIIFFFNFQRIFCLLKNLTKIFTPFCRSRRADSKYIYFVGVCAWVKPIVMLYANQKRIRQLNISFILLILATQQPRHKIRFLEIFF